MALVLAVIAGAGFAAAGAASLLGVEIGSRTRAASVAIASGVLLAVAVAELFPDALETAGHEHAIAGFLVGFGVLFIAEAVTSGHLHHDAADATEHAHQHSVWPFIVGLGLHNLADGVAIGASGDLADGVVSAVAVGVLVHQLPVGVSFAAVLAAEHASRQFVVRSALGLGAMIVVGAAAITVLPTMSDASVAMLGAAAAGALTYIAAGHLLPEAHRERASAIVAVAFPAALGGTAYLLLGVLGHGH